MLGRVSLHTSPYGVWVNCSPLWECIPVSDQILPTNSSSVSSMSKHSSHCIILLSKSESLLNYYLIAHLCLMWLNEHRLQITQWSVTCVGLLRVQCILAFRKIYFTTQTQWDLCSLLYNTSQMPGWWLNLKQGWSIFFMWSAVNVRISR